VIIGNANINRCSTHNGLRSTLERVASSKTTPEVSEGHPRAPQPTPDFPRFRHAKQAVGKVAGKLRCHRPWGGPYGVLARYPGEIKPLSLPPDSVPDKPPKPHPDFPLRAHASAEWAKEICGKVRCFGRWDDPQAALEEHVAVKDVFLAGKTPLHGDRLGVGNLVPRAFLGGLDFEGPVDVGRSLAMRTSRRRPIGSTPDFVRGGRGQ